MTFRDLLTDSLTEIGVLADGEVASAEMLTSGLRAFNRMIGNWSIQNLLIYAQTEETFALVGNGTQSTFLMGPTADFNTVRPKQIDGVSILTQNGIESPCDILTEEEWQRVQLKGQSTQIPWAVYPVATNPSYSLTFWPVPADASNSVKIYSLKPLSLITDVSAAYTLPPGYDLALVFNFAILLCPSYQRPVTPEIASIATKALADIKRANMRPKLLITDEALRSRRRYNIYSGR